MVERILRQHLRRTIPGNLRAPCNFRYERRAESVEAAEQQFLEGTGGLPAEMKNVKQFIRGKLHEIQPVTALGKHVFLLIGQLSVLFSVSDQYIQNLSVFRQDQVRCGGDQLCIQIFGNDFTSGLYPVKGQTDDPVHLDLTDVGEAAAFQIFPERHTEGLGIYVLLPFLSAADGIETRRILGA